MTISPVVKAIGEIDFSYGAYIPHSWMASNKMRYYNKATQERGRLNLVALLLLAEIVYWYRPAPVLDEQNNHVIGYKQKFCADKLHKDYATWADALNLTKNQVQDGIQFLVEEGFITRELRTIRLGDKTVGSVVFLEPVVSAVKELTHPKGTPVPLEGDRGPFVKGGGSLCKGRGVPLQRGTYTESTAENTPQISAETTPNAPAARVCADDAEEDVLFGNFQEETSVNSDEVQEGDDEQLQETCSSGNDAFLSEWRKQRVRDSRQAKRDAEPEAFKAFYSLYPRQENRIAALKAWKALDPDPQTVNLIMAGLERACKSARWLDDNGKYIPHPSSWLNGRRWEDGATVNLPGMRKPEREMTLQDKAEDNLRMLREIRNASAGSIFGSAGQPQPQQAQEQE